MANNRSRAVPGRSTPRFIADDELAGRFLQHGGQHAFLAAEVVVERRLGDARNLDDFADRCGRVALAVEDADGGAKQACPGLLVQLGRRDLWWRGARWCDGQGFLVGRREAVRCGVIQCVHRPSCSLLFVIPTGRQRQNLITRARCQEFPAVWLRRGSNTYRSVV